MNHEDLPIDEGSGPPGKPTRRDGEELLDPIDEDAEEIPFISRDMLHRERIDLEAGMKAFPPLTVGLMLACIAVYVRQVWVGGLENRMRVVETGAMSRDEVLRGQFWRLISGGFMLRTSSISSATSSCCSSWGWPANTPSAPGRSCSSTCWPA
jgi:hypothetical protein